MAVDTSKRNAAFEVVLSEPGVIIFVDANFFIPPDRSKVGVKPIALERYKEIWLEPLFNEFANLAVHEAVYEEIVSDSLKKYIDSKCDAIPTKLQVHKDSFLTEMERSIMESYMERISEYSLYSPSLDNPTDRGEVKTLSYMAVKNYLYFAANDKLAIRVVDKAQELNTGLDNMSVIKAYEVIYYLYKAGKYDKNGLRLLYKYLYYLTAEEKKNNPSWSSFIEQMDALYQM